MAASRTGMVNRNQPEPTKIGLILDREINNTDSWLIIVDGKKMVVNKTMCEGMVGEGKVLMRFINKCGTNVERY